MGFAPPGKVTRNSNDFSRVGPIQDYFSKPKLLLRPRISPVARTCPASGRRGSAMNRIIRRSLIGALAGGAASAVLIATAGHLGRSLLLGAAIGAAFAVGM